MDQTPDYSMDKLSYEIFSILENNFLFSPKSPATPLAADHGKVRILSVDGSSSSSYDPIPLLSHLESSLRRLSGDPSASLSDFFDLVAASGPTALSLLLPHHSRSTSSSSSWWWSPHKKTPKFPKTLTLRDVSKPVLIPCYDLSTGSPFVFSRADAVESECYDFRLADVVSAASAKKGAKVRSVDGRSEIVAVGGDAAVGNPTAVAITHVLNNKMEFPFAKGVEDLIVVSVDGGGERVGRDFGWRTPCRKEMTRIATNGAADMVDQAVAMAFENAGSSNYLRIQGSGSKKTVENVLTQRNIKSVMFRGKKITEQTNAEKLEWFAGELVKEQERRKTSVIPTVLIKHMMTPRTSSATTSTMITSSTGESSTSP